MTKHFFKSLTIILLGLLVGVTNAWADDPNPETDYYWARLTARSATGTGGSGKVYVSESYSAEESDFQITSSADGNQPIFIMASVSLDVSMNAFAKADAGSYFAGWSFTEGNTDLGNEDRTSVGITPSSTKGHSNIREYTIYAAFEPVKIVSSRIVSGTNTTADDGLGNWTCTQTVRFRAETPNAWSLSTEGDKRHFKLPTLTRKAGTEGTWSTSITEWSTSNISFYGNYAELNVPVTFTAPNGGAGEYGATLTLETYAGVKMNVYLYARTIVDGEEAIRYNSAKVQQEAGDLSDLLENASDGDIIKLNDDYNGTPVTINKNITFDLNGFDFETTLTIGGDVTIPYSPYGGEVTGKVTVNTGGKLTANGGRLSNTSDASLQVCVGAEAVINGATITGAVTNQGTLTLTDGKLSSGVTSAGTLNINGGTINNASGAAVTVSDGTVAINRGSVYGSTYGVSVSKGSVTIEKLAAISGDTKDIYRTGGAVTVNNGKFTDPSKFAQGDITFHAGYFKTNTSEATSVLGKSIWRNTAGTEYRDGYTLFAGDQAAAQTSNVSVCRIGTTAYASLEEALTYANNNPTKPMLIFLENDYTLPAGYYTIPANATLIVPMSDDQNVAYSVVKRQSGSFPPPVEFRRLTFESGVNMTVFGTIELTCAQYCKSGSAEQSIPGGPYGHLVLKPGSHITLSNGGELRAWGYVTGDGTRDANGTYLSGEIDARRGSIVREQFQIGDWKGGDISFTLILDQNPQNKLGLFPIYEYFIQNVESPVKYHPGSSLFCSTAVDVADALNAYANDIKVVGVNGEAAMFLMDQMADADNTWVRKWYDANKDQQVYEVNSGAQLGSMVINLGEIPQSAITEGASGVFKIQLDSRKFILPLTSNFKIHLLTGNMQFTQSTSCLPGMEVEIDKESTISIINQYRDEVVEGALYLYDSEQWGKYVQNGKYGTIVHYSATLDAKPAVRDVSTAAALGDAILNVHGTFQVGEDCAVYTTVGKTEGPSGVWTANPTIGGASIISTNEDAGTFIYKGDAPATSGVTITDGMFVFEAGALNPSVLVNYDNSSNGLEIGTARYPETPKHIFGFQLCASALLKNGEDAEEEFAETEGAQAGDAYCFMNGQWTIMKVDADDDCFMVDNYGTFYAKPAEYVAVVASKDGEGKITGNEDHTFSDKAGAGRLFILMKDCQWWEVENVDNLYHCIHPNNDTYYYWQEEVVVPNPSDPENPTIYPAHWEEKKFTITWKNWNGDIIQTTDENGDLVDNYDVTYGTMAEFFGSNPTREPNIDYTYDFTGWSPALGPVTSDVTYTATYVEQPRKYTIIFQSEGGVEIERQFLTHNQMPVCENTPTRVGHTLQWSPAIKAVTGDATYTATWLEEPPTEYEITFYDYNGTTELQKGNVAVGTMPTPPANPSNKPATTEFTYEFDHWSPALEEVSVTSAKSYTAVYREVAKTYTVIFQDENGDEIERHDYPYGATPVCSSTPTKENTAQYTYSFAWTPQIQTVMGEATYRAVFTPTTNKYTVTLRSNNDAVCTFTGAGIYDYGTEITIGAILNSLDYEFLGWIEDETLDQSFETTVTDDITLTARITLSTQALDEEELYVDIEETLDVPGGSALNVGTLIIASNGEKKSAQITGAVENLRVWDNAIFYLQKSLSARTWYAVAVPWQVQVNGGVYGIISDEMEMLNISSNFYLISYDGAKRAMLGNVGDCWTFATNSDVMQPGILYMIYVTKDVEGLLFMKKDGAPLQTKQLTVQPYPQTTGHTYDAGWNGIANPALFHAYLNANADTYGGGANFYQRYIPDETRYEALNMEDEPLIVGAPIFVQVAANKTVVAYEDWGDAALHAPARKLIVDDSYYKIQIATDDNYTDQLYVQTIEGKEDEYVIGLDLAKAGLSSTVAQMWVERYDTKLCVNTTAPIGSSATYPLGIFAPQDGDYQIYSATEMQSGQEMYVTLNGRTIWNLAYGPYTATLTAGNHTEYGLKLIQAPATPTGVDPVTDNPSPLTVKKVLIDNHVYIIRDGEVYTVTGQKVQ